jgi:glycosyltransferase involved in cell wall biosynthesis
VLHVAECFGGGVLETVRTIAERSAAAGYPSAIAFGRRPETPEDPRSAIDPRVELFELDWRRSGPHTQISVVRRLREIVREFEPEVVHLHSSFASCTGALALAGRIPLVFTPHAFASARPDAGLGRRLYTAGEKFAVQRCDIVGAVSEDEAAEARLRGARRVVTIPNGIPELDWPDQDVHERHKLGRPRVIAAGRITPQRQPEATGRILAKVADIADVKWVGGGGATGRDGIVARESLATDGIPVTGWLPREDALAEMSGAKIYLHWTAWDGMPLQILEAMARDTIVVASDIGPNRELLDPRQVCSTEEEAAALMRRVLTEPAFAKELVRLQRQRRRLHSADAMVGGWQSLYSELGCAASWSPALQAAY